MATGSSFTSESPPQGFFPSVDPQSDTQEATSLGSITVSAHNYITLFVLCKGKFELRIQLHPKTRHRDQKVTKKEVFLKLGSRF